MFLYGVITILLGKTLLTSASSEFIPIPSTPFVGKLPLDDKPASYDIAGILNGLGIRPDSVEDILVYVFFTGLGGGAGPESRAFYEIYTESSNGTMNSQFLNAVFDQPDSVINSENLWIPYTNLAPPGSLYAQKISANSPLSHIQFANAEQQSVEYNNLHEAMNAYVQGTDSVFRDIYLIAYRN